MKTFDLGDVLSVTTQRVVSLRGFDAVHDVIGYMVGDEITTTGILAMTNRCRDSILRQYPELAKADSDESIKDLERLIEAAKKINMPIDEAIGAWLNRLQGREFRLKATYEIAPLSTNH